MTLFPSPDRRPDGGQPHRPRDRRDLGQRQAGPRKHRRRILAVDHFRYFAGAIRAQEGSIGEIDQDTVGYHIHEPLGVLGQIIPWNFPILMAVWKLAPAIAAAPPADQEPARQPLAQRPRLLLSR